MQRAIVLRTLLLFVLLPSHVLSVDAAVPDAQVNAFTSGEILPPRDVSRLVADADVIILGTIHDVTDLGPVHLDNPYPRQGRLITGEISVRQVLKGAAEGETFVFWSPVWEFVLQEGHFFRHTDVVMFITRSNGNNEFVSPYTPVVRTLPGARAQGRSALDRVASAVAAVLYDAAASSERKREAMRDLQGFSEPRAIAGLHAALHDEKCSVAIRAAAALFRMNDVEALPLAEDVLLRKQSACSRIPGDLESALRQVTDPRAIPAFARILKGGDAESRREVATALGRMKSTDALRPLGEALNDDDYDVRLNAARGLGNLTGNTHLLPLDQTFFENEAGIIAEWKTRLARLGVTIP